mmetsp:Transcript_88529/g.258772  ORF Transcript_88529/g.258772 Transcript_88529/m.258772 type:complete len:238 (-) Transcript_88529:257-970(-)
MAAVSFILALARRGRVASSKDVHRAIGEQLLQPPQHPQAPRCVAVADHGQQQLRPCLPRLRILLLSLSLNVDLVLPRQQPRRRPVEVRVIPVGHRPINDAVLIQLLHLTSLPGLELLVPVRWFEPKGEDPLLSWSFLFRHPGIPHNASLVPYYGISTLQMSGVIRHTAVCGAVLQGAFSRAAKPAVVENDLLFWLPCHARSLHHMAQSSTPVVRSLGPPPGGCVVGLLHLLLLLPLL